MPRHERLQHQRSTGNILNRMRHNVRKILLIHKRNPNNNENNSNNNNNNNNDNDDIRRNQTVNKKRDWRTLSPECPPLPSVDLSPPNGDTILSNTAHLNNSNGAEHLTSLTDNKIEASTVHTTLSTNNSTSITTTTSSNNNNNNTSPLPPFQFSHSYHRSTSFSTIATGVVIEGRHLYTIPEEGETMDASLQNSNEHYPPPSSVRVSDESSPSSPSSSSVSSNSSSIMYRPPTAWFTEMPDAPHDDTLIGDEARCQLKLARIVQAASKQQKHDQNARTEILFDDHDNVRSIRIITRHTDDNNKITDEYWRFSGNSQYLPPELPCGVYNQSLADVWIMGIISYRMLVGKYPFTAPNDRKLFSKMMHGDFSIPGQLSDDAKDLLRRMLAPGNARASLDLILFHPWLKPCSSIILRNNNSNTNNDSTEQQPVSSSSSSGAIATTASPDPPPKTSHPVVVSQKKKQKQPLSSVHPTIPQSSRQSQQHGHHDTSVSVKSCSSSSLPIKKQNKTKRKKRRRQITRSIMRIFFFLTKGPYPPPNQPYRELALLDRVHPTTATV